MDEHVAMQNSLVKKYNKKQNMWLKRITLEYKMCIIEIL